MSESVDAPADSDGQRPAAIVAPLLVSFLLGFLFGGESKPPHERLNSKSTVDTRVLKLSQNGEEGLVLSYFESQAKL